MLPTGAHHDTRPFPPASHTHATFVSNERSVRQLFSLR